MSDGALPPANDPYALLGVTPDVDLRALQRAYAAAIRRFRPDTHPYEFQRVRWAFETLRHRVSRADADHGAPASPTSDPAPLDVARAVPAALPADVDVAPAEERESAPHGAPDASDARDQVPPDDPVDPPDAQPEPADADAPQSEPAQRSPPDAPSPQPQGPPAAASPSRPPPRPWRDAVWSAAESGDVAGALRAARLRTREVPDDAEAYKIGFLLAESQGRRGGALAWLLRGLAANAELVGWTVRLLDARSLARLASSRSAAWSTLQRQRDEDAALEVLQVRAAVLLAGGRYEALRRDFASPAFRALATRSADAFALQLEVAAAVAFERPSLADEIEDGRANELRRDGVEWDQDRYTHLRAIAREWRKAAARRPTPAALLRLCAQSGSASPERLALLRAVVAADCRARPDLYERELAMLARDAPATVFPFVAEVIEAGDPVRVTGGRNELTLETYELALARAQTARRALVAPPEWAWCLLAVLLVVDALACGPEPAFACAVAVTVTGIWWWKSTQTWLARAYFGVARAACAVRRSTHPKLSGDARPADRVLALLTRLSRPAHERADRDG